MVCPKCGAFAVVKNSRIHGNSIKRKRECEKCGYVFHTLETAEALAMKKRADEHEEREKEYAIVLDYLISVIENEKRKLKKG
jgi:transcriptional regulator NrdR family protein